MRFWKCALRYWFLISWTCLHENITGTWVILVIWIGQFRMKRGKRFKEFRSRIMLLLKLWCRLQKRDKVHDTLCSMFLSIFFFQFLSRPTTFAKRSGIQLGTESHRAWFSVLTSHFTTTLPASLANLSALWAASEMLTTLSANRAVKSNAPVSSCQFSVSWD